MAPSHEDARRYEAASWGRTLPGGEQGDRVRQLGLVGNLPISRREDPRAAPRVFRRRRPFQAGAGWAPSARSGARIGLRAISAVKSTPPITPAPRTVLLAPSDPAIGPVSTNETGTSAEETNQSTLATRPRSSLGTRRWSMVCQTISPVLSRPKMKKLDSIASHSAVANASVASANIEAAQTAYMNTSARRGSPLCPTA